MMFTTLWRVQLYGGMTIQEHDSQRRLVNLRRIDSSLVGAGAAGAGSIFIGRWFRGDLLVGSRTCSSCTDTHQSHG